MTILYIHAPCVGDAVPAQQCRINGLSGAAYTIFIHTNMYFLLFIAWKRSDGRGAITHLASNNRWDRVLWYVTASRSTIYIQAYIVFDQSVPSDIFGIIWEYSK